MRSGEITSICPAVQGVAGVHDKRIRHMRDVLPRAGFRRDLQTGNAGLRQKCHEVHIGVRRDAIEPVFPVHRWVVRQPERELTFPKGGTKEKPIGLVYIGIKKGTKILVSKNHFNSNKRNLIQKASVNKALNLVLSFTK